MDPVDGTKQMFTPNARITYMQEDGVWWAYTSLRFSAADDDLEALRVRVHQVLQDIVGGRIEYTEIVQALEHPWNDTI